MLVIRSIFIQIAVIQQQLSGKVHFEQKITVAISKRMSFVIFTENATPKGLHVLIIEKFRLEIPSPRRLHHC